MNELELLNIAVILAGDGHIKEAEMVIADAKCVYSRNGAVNKVFWNLSKAVEAEVFYQQQVLVKEKRKHERTDGN